MEKSFAKIRNGGQSPKKPKKKKKVGILNLISIIPRRVPPHPLPRRVPPRPLTRRVPPRATQRPTKLVLTKCTRHTSRTAYYTHVPTTAPKAPPSAEERAAAVQGTAAADSKPATGLTYAQQRELMG